MQSKRLFLGVPPDGGTQEALEGIQQSLKASLPPGLQESIRWTHPGELHMTFFFLGSLTADTQFSVEEALQEVKGASLTQPLDKFLLFPKASAAKVLTVGNDKCVPELQSLLEAIKEPLVNLGIKLEERTFYPHITLGRFRTEPAGNEFRRMALGPLKFPVKRFVLYESKLEKLGARYEMIQEFPLARPTPA